MPTLLWVYTEKAGQIAPDVFFVGAKKFHGLRRGLEHGGIAHVLMTADKKPELFGDREGHHEMVTRFFRIPAAFFALRKAP